MQGLNTSQGYASSIDEQPETPFAAGDTIPAGYSTSAGTAGVQTTPFTSVRNIPVEGPDSDRTAASPNTDITSTTVSEVIRLNQRAASPGWPGAQPASTFGTQPDSSIAGNAAPQGVQLSNTPLLGGSAAVTTQPIASAPRQHQQQQQGTAGSGQLPSHGVFSSSQHARLSEPSTAASDTSTGLDRSAGDSAQPPLREERSLRSIYSLGELLLNSMSDLLQIFCYKFVLLMFLHMAA